MTPGYSTPSLLPRGLLRSAAFFLTTLGLNHSLPAASYWHQPNSVRRFCIQGYRVLYTSYVDHDRRHNLNFFPSGFLSKES